MCLQQTFAWLELGEFIHFSLMCLLSTPLSVLGAHGWLAGHPPRPPPPASLLFLHLTLFCCCLLFPAPLQLSRTVPCFSVSLTSREGPWQVWGWTQEWRA